MTPRVVPPGGQGGGMGLGNRIRGLTGGRTVGRLPCVKEGRVGRRSGHEGRPFAGGGEEAGDGSTVREDRGEGAEWVGREWVQRDKRGRWDGDGDGRDSEGVAGGTCSGSAGRGDRQGRRRLKVGQRAGLVGRVGGWGSKQGESRGLADSEWTERGQSA
ncbi:hypothetical protein EDB85DRAFT_1893281 [Lactarius pseudohatsudake]|nr:hypothetical protein EDB85DRAFT_1893281 [Lactarius pseudohatsudake]